MRDRGRGETNDELRRLRSTRGKMPKVKTHSVLAIVKGHERGNCGILVSCLIGRFHDWYAAYGLDEGFSSHSLQN